MHWLVASLLTTSVFFSTAGAHAQACVDKGAKTALETCSLPQKPVIKAISGRCEVSIAGSAPVSCARIQLLLRARGVKNAKVHAAAIDGFNFEFTDLRESSYDIVLASSEFKLLSNLAYRSFEPGTKDLKIRIDAKPLK